VKPDAVLFDAGGTLVHLDPRWVGPALESAVGQAPDPDRMVDAHYRTMHDFGARLSATGRSDAEEWGFWMLRFLERTGVDPTPEAVAALGELRGVWTKPIEGVREAVTGLAADGVRVAVVSNADGTVEETLAVAGYDGVFEFVVDSSVVGISKPDPRIFDGALERLGLPPDRVWYVGDSMHHDVGGATAAGLAVAVLVDPLDLSPEYRPRVDTVADLPALIDGAAAR
jgi:putative hydrolase of the HAD superfamily